MAQNPGLSSENIKFYYGTPSTSSVSYTQLKGLYEIPNMGNSPELLDCTPLDSPCKLNTKGIIDYGQMDFSFWYMPAVTGTSPIDSNFETAKSLEVDGQGNPKTMAYKVDFPDGTTFEFEGQATVYTDSVGINSNISFKITIALTTAITTTCA